MRVECLPVTERHLISYEIKCHFFITITNEVSRNKMIEMYLRNFITKILFFISSNLLSFSRIEVDTQQLMFPIYNYTFYEIFKQANKLKFL